MTSLLNSFFNLDGKSKCVDDNCSEVKHSNLNVNLPTPSLSQGNKFKYYQKKIKKNLENDIENVNTIEGFTSEKIPKQETTGQTLTQTTNNVLKKTSITAEDKKTLENLKIEYQKTLDEYQNLLKDITKQSNQYISRTSSSNPYLNKTIRFSSGHIAYVTNQGVVKLISDKEILDSLNIPKKYVDVNIPWLPEYDVNGTLIPTNPPLITGTPAEKGQIFGFEGANVFVNSLIGNEAPKHIGCYIDDYENPNLTYINDKKPPRPSQDIMNGNFSIPELNNNSFKYINNDSEVVGWVFNAVIINNSSAWGYPRPYPNGAQAVSLQNKSTMSQTLFLAPGKYNLMFHSVGRRCCGKNGGPNPVNVYLDSNKIFGFTAASDRWRKQQISFEISKPGDYTIKFEGTNSNGDKSTAIHDIIIELVESKNPVGSFTFEECKQSAIDKLFQFFSLQEVDKNTNKGFCGVTNQKPFLNCKSDPKLVNGQTYEFSQVGNVESMGKLGFVDPDSKLYPYSSDEVSLTNEYISLKNKDSYGNDIQGAAFRGGSIDTCKEKCNSLENCYGFTYFQNVCYPKDKRMFPEGQLQTLNNASLYLRNRVPKDPPLGVSSKVYNIGSNKFSNYEMGDGEKEKAYGLSVITDLNKQQLSQLETRLAMLTKQIATYSDKFYNDINLINKQSINNVNELNNFTNDIKDVNYKIKNFSSDYSRIAEETDINVLQANYTYMMWSILAVGTVLVSMNVMK